MLIAVAWQSFRLSVNLAIADRFGVPALAGHAPNRLKPGLQTQKRIRERFIAKMRGHLVSGILLVSAATVFRAVIM